MNVEYKNQNAYGVDFLDIESGERIVHIENFETNPQNFGKILALTNRGSLYTIDMRTGKAARFNPTLGTGHE